MNPKHNQFTEAERIAYEHLCDLSTEEITEANAQLAFAFVTDTIRYRSQDDVLNCSIVFLLTVMGLYDEANPNTSYTFDSIKHVILQAME